MVPGIPLWPPRGLPRPALASFACRTIDHEGAFLGIDFGGRGASDLLPTSRAGTSPFQLLEKNLNFSRSEKF